MVGRTCIGCGGDIPHTRATQARYCTRLCGKRAFREKDPEKARQQVRSANQRRYQTDAEYRAAAVTRNRRWRRANTYGDPNITIPQMTKDRYRMARALGYRSGLEVQVARQLETAGVSFEYETLTLRYRVEETRRYTPDFVLHNGIIVETKGVWVTSDRKKIKLVKEQYPHLDLRIVLSNPNARIGKKSKTTYARWCESHGLPYAKQYIPEAWLLEPANNRSLALIRSIKDNS